MTDPTPPPRPPEALSPPPPADVAQAVERLKAEVDIHHHGFADLDLDDVGKVLAHLRALQSRVAAVEREANDYKRALESARLDLFRTAAAERESAQAQVAALREALAPFVNDGREIRDCCGEDGYDNHPDLIVALDAAEAALAPPPASDPKEAK